MEFRQLKYFLAVVEEGQITKAANRLHITQPPISQQIILLEKELGVQLLQRTKKHIRPTEAGCILQHRAEQIMELVKTTMDEVQEASSGIRGKLTIGTITSSGRSLIPEHIQKFHQAYPLISYDLRQGDTRRILELLNSRLIEIGFVRLPVDTSLYHYIALPDENMVMVASPDATALPAGKELPLDAFKNQSLLMHKRYETVIFDYCRQAGFDPRILCTSDDVTPLLIWARLGLGIAIVPETAIHLLQDSPLLVKKITKPPITTTSAVIWLKNHVLSATAAHFLAMFQEKKAGLTPDPNSPAG